MRRIALVVVAALLVSPLLGGPAAAADVNQTIAASQFQFHLGSKTGTTSITVTVTAGDTLRLRIENYDDSTPNHTFTLPHFSVNVTLPDGTDTDPAIVFVNVTTTASDAGRWQFYCIPHSSGPEGSRTGMVGTVEVKARATPGFEALAAVGALAAAFVIVWVVHRRR